MSRYIYLLIFIIYIVVMTGVMIWQGIGIAPDRYILILLVGSLLIKRTRQFLLDWMPFLFILIAYDFLRGFAGNLTSRVHYIQLSQVDRMIFGVIPTQFLQAHFFNPHLLHWYDFVATVFYFLHFALPLAFGFLLWSVSRTKFRQFTFALLIMSYAAWISYVIYPAAPPWLAAQKGLLPGVTKILDVTLNFFPEKISLPTIYHQIDPNEVAAVPSMHAAYPFLVLLFMIKFFKRKGLFFLPYVLIVWVSTIYLGEHYTIDVILGVVYASFFFVISQLIYKKVNYFKIN